MKKIIFAFFLIISTGNSALADGTEPLLSSDNRIKELRYNEQDVYTITTKYGYQTNIVFGKSEEIQTISVGDRSLWQLIPAGNRLFIRPMEYNMQTNMTLITNKHSYQFDLKCVKDEKSKGNIYVARFSYPEDEAKKAEKIAATPPPYLLAQAVLNQSPPTMTQPTPVPPAQPQPVFAPPVPKNTAPSPSSSTTNYNYTYAGPDDAAPIKSYDDGQSTFIQYRENQSLPSVYMIDANGNAKPVSYNVENNNLVVINMVAGKWRLEENNGTVYLYNEILNPEQ